MALDTTLLDLDRDPTPDELKAFFKKHDWSAAKLSNPCSRDLGKVADMKEIQKIMDAEFEKHAREKGIGAASKYFENRRRIKGVGGNVFVNQGNPLLELRDSTEDLVSDAVYEIAVNHEDVLEAIFNQFDLTDPDLERKADAFLHNAVGTMLDVMEYDKLAGVVHNLSAAEDFNPYLYPNFRAQDHNKKWYHKDSEVQIEYCPDPESKLPPERTIVDPERIAIFNLMVEDYWNTLDDTEKKIYRFRKYGYTQGEIAKMLGYSGNSAVSKRLKTMRAKFKDVTGI